MSHYVTYDYDTNGFLSSTYFYDDAGADNTWFTSDDVLSLETAYTPCYGDICLAEALEN